MRNDARRRGRPGAIAAAAIGGMGRASGRALENALGGAERTRVIVLLAAVLAGAGVGFAVTGDLAALSWRAAFLVLAFPAFVLAWLIFRLPEPARGGSGALASPKTPAGEPGDGDPATDAQRLARERGLEPDPELLLTRDPRRLGIFAATRYVLRIRTNVVLISASACGYFFLAGVQTFGVEFVTKQYGIGQALGTLVLLVVGV